MKGENKLQVVVETEEFKQKAKKLMSETAKTELINYLAKNPREGSLIQESGGARKLRWYKDASSGKRGGVRTIYYYHDQNMPIFLFTVYGKNQRANLSHEERHELKEIIQEIVKTYKEGTS
jgi:hypothetical protein